mmetsp:Transcript_12686/g.32605  ORF Transcript_12686/g.32605 Transcript_12686/m.32605 type:complete len:209 (+) Transcript_12686:98-724(+)
MDPGAFAAQMRAQAMQHAAQAQQLHAANAAGRKRCASIALVMHVVLAVVIAALLWALYFLLRNTTEPQPRWTPEGLTVNRADHPWPMWVNWIWMVVILGSPLFTLCSTLPLLCSWRLGPAWNMIVVGNLVVVNVMLWIIYGISACKVYRYSYYSEHDVCDFPWPAIVTACSIAIVIITSAIACVTHTPSSTPFRDVESAGVVKGVVLN